MDKGDAEQVRASLSHLITGPATIWHVALGAWIAGVVLWWLA